MRNILTMKKKVEIKYACDENWDSMSKLDDLTRFCSVCNKNIKDYSRQVNLESEKIHCGRFSLSQISSIHREFSMKILNPLTLTLLSVIGATINPQEVLGQDNPVIKEVTNQKTGKIKLSGLVRDKRNNDPLPFAYVTAKISDKIIEHTQTNLDGQFEMTIDTTIYKLDKIEVIFSYPGYKNDTLKSMTITKDLLCKDVTISLDAALNFDIEVSDFMSTTGLITIDSTTKKRKRR